MKGMVVVSLNINKFILIDSIKMYERINIDQEIIIMACVLHQLLTWVCALIITHALLNPIGVITIVFIFKGENCLKMVCN